MSETIDRGNYEILRQRIEEQASALTAKTDALNEARKATFGGSELAVVANERVRTENNCVPRDLISFRDILILGYKVFLGLKTEVQISDVLSLHRFVRHDDGSWDLGEIPRGSLPGFLDDPRFVKEFSELFRYYRETKLRELRVTDDRILVIVQTGASLADVRVFRWSIDAQGQLAYLDDRGERDNVAPPSHDFDWIATTREDQRSGRHPHISIRDELFVETVGGDLTVKIEDNTETGQGIYREPVDDPNQALDDAEIHYAFVGGLILLKIKPYREQQTRGLVFNRLTREVRRVDAIIASCRQLPEDHGIVFPGGYLLELGDGKVVDPDSAGLELIRVAKSPNGEDILYVYHRRDTGLYQLLSYNLIRKELAPPILCHGMSLFEDGTLVFFRSTSEEPSRVHPVQIWKTPFTSAEHAARATTSGSFLAKVGNAELVRGISDALSIAKLARKTELARTTYEEIIKAASRVEDAYYWLGSSDAFDLKSAIFAVKKTAELVIDELEKVLAMRKRAQDALREAEGKQRELRATVRPEDMRSVSDFMRALTQLRGLRGQLVSLRELRYADLSAIDVLEKSAAADQDAVSRACMAFLANPEALAPISVSLDELDAAVPTTARSVDARPLAEKLEEVGQGLTVLTDVVAGLDVDDPLERAKILENIGDVFAKQNRVRALLDGKRKELFALEGRAAFGAAMRLLSQSVSSSLAVATTPEACDAELARLLVSLEETEAKFGELDEFVLELAKKREEITDALGARKQLLVEERQKRAQSLVGAAERILEGVARRARTFKTEEELQAYFASDAMVAKLQKVAEQLREIGDAVRADELEGRTKSARQDALRALRDKLDLFEGGESIVRLGRHRFSVHGEPFDLVIVPKTVDDAERLCLHLTGTDFFETIDDPALHEARAYWGQALVSETEGVYRAEYLAGSILFDVEEGRGPVDLAALQALVRDEAALLELVRTYAQPRYDEGYDRGVHDVDAAKILASLVTLRGSAGLLRFSSTARSLALVGWAFSLDPAQRQLVERRARSLGKLRDSTGQPGGLVALAAELASIFATTARTFELEDAEGGALSGIAARYLVEELTRESPRFITSAAAKSLEEALRAHLELAGVRRAFDDDLRALEAEPRARLSLVRAWMRGVAEKEPALAHAELEASVLVATDRKLDREVSHALVASSVAGLTGQHRRIESRTLPLRLDEFVARLTHHRAHDVPRFRAYRELRHTILERERRRLRLEELRPKPMSAFVRNKLVDQVYLPLVGDNLAKQIGVVGEDKRTDTMGLLLLVSPPGYGKTTLMEYVANRLGLVFVKVNGPSLGHEVRSIDPAEAPNATARQEVEKINLALEMGSNVMLYLDDIQHTHAELLQKFISMCDAQRKMEGVWRGKTRTYDLRGKKFCVVMAGNPYTETGEKFRIPDMLANRADTYNLGEVLEGKFDAFALSYIENSLTANAVLAPLTARSPKDVDVILRMAKGESLPASDLEYGYAGAELAEIVTVLGRLFRIRDVVLQVNLEYIKSASQEDTYRTEPPFKLQGSYRNMTKMAGKVVAAMNDDELERLIDDHYRGESQTLTTGAEQNLLKLGELRGRLDATALTRWAEIKAEFRRQKSLGGREDDPVTRVTGTLSSLGRELESIRTTLESVATRAAPTTPTTSESEARTAAEVIAARGLEDALLELRRTLDRLARPEVNVTVDAPKGYAELLATQLSLTERTIVPLVQGATKNLEDSHALHEHMIQLLELLKRIDLRLRDGA